MERDEMARAIFKEVATTLLTEVNRRPNRVVDLRLIAKHALEAEACFDAEELARKESRAFEDALTGEAANG